MDPLDYPQIWQKPSYQVLLNCLRQLRLEPPSWDTSAEKYVPRGEDTCKDYDGNESSESWEAHRAQHRQAVTTYLTKIIASPLPWISCEEEREVLWEEASRRLSERCGRSAMGEMTRIWEFYASSLGEGDSTPLFSLSIREPPLTGDHLGLKTWCSSYVMAQMIPELGKKHLIHLFGPCNEKENARPTILELGSGTGLLGLAAAVFLRTHVILTDLPDILPNLAHNAQINSSLISSMGGAVSCASLPWGCEDAASRSSVGPMVPQYDAVPTPPYTQDWEKNSFSLILVADPLYDSIHPEILTKTIDAQLMLLPSARTIVTVPLRDENTRQLLSLFHAFMRSLEAPLICFEEGIAKGQDDWYTQDSSDYDEDDSTTLSVQCWWGIFKRKLI